jgi:D-aminopeptidase
MDFQQLQCELLLDRWRNERQLGQPRSACGPTNRISDVAGVRVGHVTLAEGERQTGVTAIVPPGDNLYLTPLPCGAEVLNGFAKPVGLTQVEELGVYTRRFCSVTRWRWARCLPRWYGMPSVVTRNSGGRCRR